MEAALERRFHSPYGHWVSGFVAEIAVFIGTIAVLMFVGILSAWLFG